MSREKKWLEKLMDRIPGFRGYRSREYIREDDQLIREYVSNLFLEAIHQLDKAIQNLITYDFKSAERLDNIVREARIAMDRVRWAVHGYKPHYDIMKIGEEDLKRIREVDEKLIQLVDELGEYADSIYRETRRGNPVGDKMDRLWEILDKISEVLEERSKVLSGLSEESG